MLVKQQLPITAKALLIDTRAKATTMAIAAVIDTVQTGGYATISDNGGATYKRVGAEPAHIGKFQDASGAWFEIVDKITNSAQFGVTTADNGAQLNLYLDYITRVGGTHYWLPGSYTHTVQTEIDLAYPNELLLICDGVTQITTGAIGGLYAHGKYTPYRKTIRGLTRDCWLDAAATFGTKQANTDHLWYEACTWIFGNNDAAFVPHQMRQTDTEDTNTACFWTSFPHCGFRFLSSTHSGSPTVKPQCAIRLYGAQNATIVNLTNISGVADGVIIGHETGIAKVLANGVFVNNTWFETLDNAGVRVECVAGHTPPTGLVIGPNRYEDMDYILDIDDCDTNGTSPPQITVGYSVPGTFTNYIKNANNLDFALQATDVGADNTQPNWFRNYLGHVFYNANNAEDTLTVYSAGVNSGLAFKNNGNNKLAWMRFLATGVFEIAGNWALGVGLFFNSIGGLSATAVRAKNFRGAATLVTGSVSVVFATAEDDASYDVHLTAQGPCNGSLSVNGKIGAGFDIVSTDNTDTASVAWFIIRR